MNTDRVPRFRWKPLGTLALLVWATIAVAQTQTNTETGQIAGAKRAQPLAPYGPAAPVHKGSSTGDQLAPLIILGAGLATALGNLHEANRSNETPADTPGEHAVIETPGRPIIGGSPAGDKGSEAPPGTRLGAPAATSNSPMERNGAAQDTPVTTARPPGIASDPQAQQPSGNPIDTSSPPRSKGSLKKLIAKSPTPIANAPFETTDSVPTAGNGGANAAPAKTPGIAETPPPSSAASPEPAQPDLRAGAGTDLGAPQGRQPPHQTPEPRPWITIFGGLLTALQSITWPWFVATVALLALLVAIIAHFLRAKPTPPGRPSVSVHMGPWSFETSSAHASRPSLTLRVRAKWEPVGSRVNAKAGLIRRPNVIDIHGQAA